MLFLFATLRTIEGSKRYRPSRKIPRNAPLSVLPVKKNNLPHLQNQRYNNSYKGVHFHEVLDLGFLKRADPVTWFLPWILFKDLKVNFAEVIECQFNFFAYSPNMWYQFLLKQNKYLFFQLVFGLDVHVYTVIWSCIQLKAATSCWRKNVQFIWAPSSNRQNETVHLWWICKYETVSFWLICRKR